MQIFFIMKNLAFKFTREFKLQENHIYLLKTLNFKTTRWIRKFWMCFNQTSPYRAYTSLHFWPLEVYWNDFRCNTKL